MSFTQFCFSARQAGAGLRSSLKKVAVGARPAWADRVCRQAGLRPGRRRTGHGSRFTAETARSVPSPSAPERALAFGDNLNRLTNLAATHVPTSTPITNFGYQYDAAGNRTQKSTLDYTEDYGYDPLYRLTRADRTNPGATPPNQWTWGYDAVGNRTSAQKDQEATTSTHNEKNQLLSTTGGGKMLWRGVLDEPGIATFSAASASINGQPARMLAGNVFEATLDLPAGANTVTIQAQDGSGNVSSKSYSVNVLGVPATYTYDANGNLATKTEGADAWVYTWNALNELTAVTKNGAIISTYQYDPRGRRVQNASAQATTGWAYDGSDILRQSATSAAATTTTSFLQGPRFDEPLAMEDPTSSAITFLHADALGSITRHTNSGGSITNTISYDAWGQIQSGNPALYAFTGREWDAAVSLYQYRSRWYSPEDGRFVSEDRIGFDGGMNFYGYVGGRPHMFVDPQGFQGPDDLPVPVVVPKNQKELDAVCGKLDVGGCYKWRVTLECTGCVPSGDCYRMKFDTTVDVPIIYTPWDDAGRARRHEQGHIDINASYIKEMKEMIAKRPNEFESIRACRRNCEAVNDVIKKSVPGMSHTWWDWSKYVRY